MGHNACCPDAGALHLWFSDGHGHPPSETCPFPATLIGALIKPLVFGDDKPMRRNSPASPELFMADPTQCDFERERAQLMQAIARYATAGAVGCTQHPHPFFGPLQPHQWAILMYKHVDHHLRQFGV